MRHDRVEVVLVERPQDLAENLHLRFVAHTHLPALFESPVSQTGAPRHVKLLVAVEVPDRYHFGANGDGFAGVQSIEIG